MKFETVMMIIGVLVFLGSIVWMVLDLQRRNRPYRERMKALVEEARRIAEEDKG
jgi:hypothetical protein